MGESLYRNGHDAKLPKSEINFEYCIAEVDNQIGNYHQKNRKDSGSYNLLPIDFPRIIRETVCSQTASVLFCVEKVPEKE